MLQITLLAWSKVTNVNWPAAGVRPTMFRVQYAVVVGTIGLADYKRAVEMGKASLQPLIDSGAIRTVLLSGSGYDALFEYCRSQWPKSIKPPTIIGMAISPLFANRLFGPAQLQKTMDSLVGEKNAFVTPNFVHAFV